MEVTVRDLKNHLSEYLHRAEGGEEIIVTSRKRPVARLLPVLKQQQKRMSFEEVCKSLEALPGLHLGKGTLLGGRGIRLHGPGGTASDIVLEERE